MTASALSAEDIAVAARRIGLEGRPLCIHSSLASFGAVRGGPQAVTSGFLEAGCTVMVPTFSWGYLVPPPPDMQPARNGWDYERLGIPPMGVGRIYSPKDNEIDPDMGAIPRALLAMEGRIRGNHPLCSFAALGPLAGKLISGQTPLAVLAPLEELARMPGLVVLMGVGLTKMTALHLAEKLADRRPFRRWANGSDGRPIHVEVGSCSEGFYRLEGILAPLERRLLVGKSLWRIFPLPELLERAAQAIRADPLLTHCDDPDCGRCNDALAGGPLV